jgi:hypothetical protein
MTNCILRPNQTVGERKKKKNLSLRHHFPPTRDKRPGVGNNRHTQEPLKATSFLLLAQALEGKKEEVEL